MGPRAVGLRAWAVRCAGHRQAADLLQPHVETALDRLLWNAQLAAALLLSLGIAWAAVRARRAVHRWRELGGAVPLAMSEEDAEEEEAERAARRRAAKAARQMVGDANDDDWPT